jgi:hypothetical protein
MSRIGLTGRVAAWAAAGVIGAASVAGVATAASSSGTSGATPVAATASSAPATTTAETASDTTSDKPHRRHPLLRRAVHGEFTAKTKDGYGQFATQRGSVTAVSGTSLTVRSPDGFTHAYTVNDDTRVRHGKDQVTISDIKVGDKVAVVASKNGETLTALWVGERAK